MIWTIAVTATVAAFLVTPALARGPDYGGRARGYRVGTPTDSGTGHCGHGVETGPRTPCRIALSAHSVFLRGWRALGHAPGWVRAARSRHRTVRFVCSIALNDHAVVCSAGVMLVDWPDRRPA